MEKSIEIILSNFHSKCDTNKNDRRTRLRLISGLPSEEKTTTKKEQEEEENDDHDDDDDDDDEEEEEEEDINDHNEKKKKKDYLWCFSVPFN